MTIYRSLAVQDAVQSFVPQTTLSASKVSESSAQVDAAVSARQVLDALHQLDQAEQHEILAHTFADSLKALQDEAKQRGFEQGIQEAQQQIEQSTQGQAQQLQAHCESLLSTITALNEQPPQCHIADADIADMILSAVEKILSFTLPQADSVHALIQQLWRDFIQQSPKELRLHPEQVALLEASQLTDMDPKISLTADPLLEMGSYRLLLQSGEVEHKLAQSLAMFERQLNELGKTD